MQITKNTTKARALRPWLCASKEETRYAINGVRILPGDVPGYVKAEATGSLVYQMAEVLVKYDTLTSRSSLFPAASTLAK